jgi:hypothetical protein
MKPIYFPFTYVPRWVAETLATCFKQFIIYRPTGRKMPDEMQLWVDANVMEVRVPVQTADEALGKVVKDFQPFASLHDDRKSLKTAVLFGQKFGIPFFGESAASQIVSDVKKGSKSESAEANFDPLFCARVFLDFAQQFDRQSDELKQGLGVNKRRSHDLLEKLSGEKDTGLPVTPLTAEIKVDDPGEYMALGRLQAWIRLFLEDTVNSGLFVTSSQSVFDHLIENPTAVEKIIQSEGLPVMAALDDAAITWRDPFLKQMKRLVETQWPAAEGAFAGVPPLKGERSKVTLTLYLLPGQSPADLFAQVLEDQNVNPIKPNQRVGFKNTLIGLIAQQPFNP